MLKYSAKSKKDLKLFEELMDLYEFKIVRYYNGLGVIDLQGADLGDISKDRFKNMYEILDRMEIYHEDYIIRDIEEFINKSYYCYQDYIKPFKNFIDKQDSKEDYQWEYDILKLISRSVKFDI